MVSQLNLLVLIRFTKHIACKEVFINFGSELKSYSEITNIMILK